MQDAVDTVVCAPNDGWAYHPKYVQQFPDKINCVTLHLVGYVLKCVLRNTTKNLGDSIRPETMDFNLTSWV